MDRLKKFFSVSLTIILISTPLSARTKIKKKKVVKAEYIISAIAQEINQSKSVKKWLNRGNKKTKRFRRMHFGKYASKKFPKVVASGHRLFVFVNGSRKAPSILKAFVKNSQVKLTWNDRDISRKPNESMEKWYQRFFPKKKKRRRKKKSVFYQFIEMFFIQEAHAGDYGAGSENPYLQNLPSYVSDEALSHWTAMMASMGSEEGWWKKQILGSSDIAYGNELINAGVYLKEKHNMICAPDGKQAYFDFYASDSGEQPERVATHFDHSAQLARISIRRLSHDALYPQGELARIAYPVGDKGTDGGAVYIRNFVSPKVPVEKAYGSINNREFHRDFYFIANQYASMPPVDPLPQFVDDAKNRMAALEALSDFARACCGNDQCRGQAGLPVSGDPVEINR